MRKDRETDPSFYVRKGYEVVKLLRDRTSFPHVLPDTHAEDSGYVFTTTYQREQIRSTLITLVDLELPCALVIASNRKGAFPEGDPEVTAFVKYIASLVRYDLVEGSFLSRLRTLRTDLFPAESPN